MLVGRGMDNLRFMHLRDSLAYSDIYAKGKQDHELCSLPGLWKEVESMRLWHTDLIEVLPKQQLLGQWRELNSIFKLQNRHILINFVYDYPKSELMTYTIKVLREMKSRGYKFDTTNFRDYMFLVRYQYQQHPFPDKMTDRYLKQCLYNLQEKYDCGGITEAEWKRITDKFGGMI